MTAQALTARIEVFRPGTFKPMDGDPITYSVADLRAIADAYDPETAPAPVVIGHPETDGPAFGWVESFDYDAAAERLFANLHEIEPQFAELVKAGRFKKVSMAFFGPDQGHNPVKGAWYPKHVGFLGAAAPAVSGLKNVKFSADAPAAVFTSSFGASQEVAGLFRALRDFFIDRFGLEEADTALPRWQIEWLDAASDDDHPAFAAPPQPVPPEKEPAVTTQPDPAFAAREADLLAREQRIAAREVETAHADNVAFAERLVQDGKLLPALKDQLVAIFDALPGHAAVSFAEGAEKLTPGAALRQVLEAQPKVVSFGAIHLPDGPEGHDGPVAFAADGKAVDPVQLERHNKALAYQRQHPGTEYLDAVRAVS